MATYPSTNRRASLPSSMLTSSIWRASTKPTRNSSGSRRNWRTRFVRHNANAPLPAWPADRRRHLFQSNNVIATSCGRWYGSLSAGRCTVGSTAVLQGAEAPAQIAAAIDLLNAWNLGVEPIDVPIVARGGGSIEETGRSTTSRRCVSCAASVIPVISGVGARPISPFPDLAADQRAPTPTGAAALAVPTGLELARAIAGTAAVYRAPPRAYRPRASPVGARPAACLSGYPRPCNCRAAQQVDELSRSMTRTAAHRLAVQRPDRRDAKRLASWTPTQCWPAATPSCRNRSAAP